MSALALCIRVKSTIMIYFILHHTYFSSVESIKKIKCFTLLIRIIITQAGVFTQWKLQFDFPFSKHWCTPALPSVDETGSRIPVLFSQSDPLYTGEQLICYNWFFIELISWQLKTVGLIIVCLSSLSKQETLDVSYL